MSNLKKFNLIGFINGFYFYVPIFTFFVLSKDISLTAVIIAQVFYSFFTFMGEVPTGLLADKFGQKSSIVLGYMIEALGLFLIVLFPTTAGLYVAYSIRGVAGSFLSGSEEALLYESAKRSGKKKFQKIYAKFLSNEQIGIIISTAVAGIIYQQFGPSSFVPLIVLNAIFIFAAGCISLSLKDYRAKIKDEAKGSGMFNILKESTSLIRRNKTIFTLTLVGILTLSGEYFLQFVYQPHFQTNNVPLIWIGLVFSLGTLMSVVSTRYAYLLEKNLSLEKILLILNIVLGLGYIIMAVFLHPIFLIASYVIMKGTFNLQTPIVSDYINSHTKSAIRTTVLSTVSLVRRFFQIFITLSLALFVNLWGVRTSFIIQGLYLIVGIAVGYYLLVRCGCTYKVNDKQKLKFG